MWGVTVINCFQGHASCKCNHVRDVCFLSNHRPVLLETSLRQTQDVTERGIQKRNTLDVVQQAMVSSTDGVNQTKRSSNNNGHAQIKKELLLRLDMLSFSRVLSNNATDATPGGCPPVNLFEFQPTLISQKVLKES